MVTWCPKCNVMLHPDAVRCPACGTLLGKNPSSDSTGRDVFWLSAYFIGIALIPLGIGLLIGLICILTGK